jgi:hypothetical protein
MDEIPQSPEVEKVLAIAQADQHRRAAQAAQVEAEHWDAEYNFWHKIITEEVERLRFNGGYEPISVDLYPATRKFGPAFMGKTQVGHVHFRVEGKWHYDRAGNQMLRVTILKDPR